MIWFLFVFIFFVANRDRTSDLKIFSLALSQLSYSNITLGQGIEP